MSLASRRLRDLDQGQGLEPVEDEAECATLAAQAARVRMGSTALAAALTALAFLLP